MNMPWEKLIDYVYPVSTVYIGETHPEPGVWVKIAESMWKRVK